SARPAGGMASQAGGPGMSRVPAGLLVSSVALASLLSGPAVAQLAVSVNDNKVRLADGKVEVVANPQPDTLAIIDLGISPPKVLGELEVPGSVVGPPSSVAVSPKEDIALVTSAMKVDPAD